MVTRHNSGRNKTRIPTDNRAHHGIAGSNFGSMRAGRSGPSFISVISLGLMTILSIVSRPLCRAEQGSGITIALRKIQEQWLYTGSFGKAQGCDSPSVSCWYLLNQ